MLREKWVHGYVLDKLIEDQQQTGDSVLTLPIEPPLLLGQDTELSVGLVAFLKSMSVYVSEWDLIERLWICQT